jgi:hypothetical protein
MERQAIILGLDHEQLIKEFISFSTMELGAIKMNEVINKVNTSGKVIRFLIEARRINAKIRSDDFLACIHSSSSFTFSKAETISVAAITLLMKWNHEVGKPNELSDDIYLNKSFFLILDKCDSFKTHINSAPNFFERFNNHLERILKISILKNNTPKIKTEIYFDSTLCGAIQSGQKTEFRTNDNLEGINFSPDEWKLEGYDREKGAKFISPFLRESITIENPYKFQSNIKVYDEANSSSVRSNIAITSFGIQRIKEVNQTDAIKEGYGLFKEKLEELFLEDPSLDGELCLFREDWIKKHGVQSFAKNEWLWVFEFKKYEQSDNYSNQISKLKLSDELIKELSNAKV